MLMNVLWTMPGAFMYVLIALEATYAHATLGMTLIQTGTTVQVSINQSCVIDLC